MDNPTFTNTQPITRTVGMRKFELMQDYTCYFYLHGHLYKLVIFKGFIYDGASIPRWLWSVLGITPKGQHDSGTIFHDIVYMLYKARINGKLHAIVGHENDRCTHELRTFVDGKWLSASDIISRNEADDIMFEIIESTENVDIKNWRLVSMRMGIKFGGAKYWRRSTPLNQINPKQYSDDA